MTCLYCTTELPVDGNTKQITCPKCGSEFTVRWRGVNNLELYLANYDPPVYGENERGDRRENY